MITHIHAHFPNGTREDHAATDSLVAMSPISSFEMYFRGWRRSFQWPSIPESILSSVKATTFNSSDEAVVPMPSLHGRMQAMGRLPSCPRSCPTILLSLGAVRTLWHHTRLDIP